MVCGGCHLARAVGNDLRSGSRSLGELIVDAGDDFGDSVHNLADEDY